MSIRLLVFLLIAVTSRGLTAEIQDGIVHQAYTWDDSTSVTQTDYDTLYDVVFVKSYRAMEWFESDFFKGEKLGFKNLFLFTTIHKRIKLNNDQGVNDYNKMYLPVSANQEIFQFHARAVNPDGTVIIFDQKNMKEVEDLEGYGAYKIFAFEGVQVGSEIEYYYTNKSLESEYYGTEITQAKEPILDYGFELISSSSYVLEGKTYNGLDELKSDTLPEKVRSLSVRGVFVPAFESEPFSLGDALKQRIEYKLVSLDGNQDEAFSWQKAADWYGRRMGVSQDKKIRKAERKAIKKWLSQLELPINFSVLEKLAAIENQLKSNFTLDAFTPSFYVHEIIKSKQYSKTSSVRLFSHVLNYLEVEHQLVLSSNRFKKVFDGDFESSSFLSHLFLFLPKEQLYVCPSSEIHRIGIIPYEFASQEALFVKTITVGSWVSAFPEVKFISSEQAKFNTDDLDINVTLSPDFSYAQAELTRRTKGHCSLDIQPYLPYYSDPQRKAVLEEFFLEIAPESEISELTTKNELIEGIQIDKPFTVSASLRSYEGIEKAGDKYLFNLGELIGPQSELYRDQNRKYDVSNTYNRIYSRTINFAVPAGFEVLNAQSFLMSDTLCINGRNVAYFSSNYEVAGANLVINIKEGYQEILIDKQHYPEYRKVINAAADFNKKALILVRKSN